MTVDERVTRLEMRMTALEQLPDRMDRFELRMERLEHRIDQVEAQLSERIDDARRETRVLHEDVLGRIAVIGEGFTAQGHVIARMVTTLDDSRTLLDTVLTRIMAIESHLPAKRRKKTPLEPE